MEIATTDPQLPFELRQTAPPGVSVQFENPKFNRAFDPNAVPPEVLILLRFAISIDVVAVANWLLEHLKDKTGTKTTYNKKRVELTAPGIRFVLESETKEKTTNK